MTGDLHQPERERERLALAPGGGLNSALKQKLVGGQIFKCLNVLLEEGDHRWIRLLDQFHLLSKSNSRLDSPRVNPQPHRKLSCPKSIHRYVVSSAVQMLTASGFCKPKQTNSSCVQVAMSYHS